jgi:HEAT repeat protein
VTERTLLDAQRRRRRAAIAGHTGDVSVPRALVDDPDASVRSAAIGALQRLGALEAADLVRALADPEPAVRRRALELVATLRGRGPAASVAIVALLDDPDDTVVEVAAWASGERESAEAGVVPRLVALATDAADALVREAAVAALGSLGDPAGLPAILTGTRDKATVRRRAVIALAPFDGPEVDAALEAARSDRDWQVRQSAEDLTDHEPGH